MKNGNGKIYIVFGLHAYQPPTQTKEIVEKIRLESYDPVAEALLETTEKSIICADISLSLLELLSKYDGQATINLFKSCVDSKKIHLVNTAAYHPILPLVPEYYIKRQLRKNLDAYENYFGIDKRDIKGLFLPEMAFSERIITSAKKSQTPAIWTMADDTAFCSHYHHCPPYNKIIKRGGLYIFLMSHIWHKRASFGEIQEGRRFLDALNYGFKEWIGNETAYVLIWMDWETFGHHDKKAAPPQDRIKNFLKPFLKIASANDKFELTTPDKLIEIFPDTIDTFVSDGSWSTSAEDYQKGIAWPLWSHPHHKFHQLWWALARFALAEFGETQNPELQELIDKALYSCQPWMWSNNKKDIAKKGLEIFLKLFEHETTSAGIKSEGIKLINEIRQL